MENKRNSLAISMRICFALLSIFMAAIAARFLTRQILVERLGWNNWFTRAIFWGDEAMGDAPTIAGENEEISVAVDYWETRYPFKSDESALKFNKSASPIQRYTSRITTIESKLEAYTGDLLFGHMQLTRIGKKYNALIGYAEMPMNSGNSVIILNNGYLTYTEPAVEQNDLELLADQVADFSEYLHEKGIYFVYANAGSKVNPLDKQLPAGAVENTNENADALLKLLAEKQVNTLDYRTFQLEQYENWYDSYYVTDHHWKNTTGLWAAGILARHLNDNAGFAFDLSYFEEDRYVIEEIPEYFLGSQGRILTTAAADLEPFCRVLPRFETDFSIQIPTQIDLRGAYDETLFRNDLFESIREYSKTDFETKMGTYDYSVMWRNDALGTVQNHMTNDNAGKRILMLQDSFGYYLSTYLATDVPEIDFLNLNGFTGSLKGYIEETQPDAVVLLLCERNIRRIDETAYNEHKHFFDFR